MKSTSNKGHKATLSFAQKVQLGFILAAEIFTVLFVIFLVFK